VTRVMWVTGIYLVGTVSLIVEGNFIVLAVICLRRIGRVWQPNSDDVVSSGLALVPTRPSSAHCPQSCGLGHPPNRAVCH
jgi:hypothetical protein